MLRPGKELNYSLSRLILNNPEIIKWFKDSLADQLDVNIDLTDEPGIRGQGKAQELREIIQFIEAAPEQVKNQQKRDSYPAPKQMRIV